MSALHRLALAALLTAMTLAATSAPAQAAPAAPCDRGELCLWKTDAYKGAPLRLSLSNSNPEECLPLPDDFEARSFVNFLSRPVTIYQARDCNTEGEFDTYPGEGTYVPSSPFVVRGIQIWSS